MKHKRDSLAEAIRFALSAGLVASVSMAAAPAWSQDEDEGATTVEDRVEEAATTIDRVVVTGSRVQRPDQTSPSPITSVDEAVLEVNNTVNIEDTLNDLPQLVPSFDASSNNPGNGTALLSLRGLGAARTLVLLDGRRIVGEGAGNLVNINVIPTALIERVDVVTGGASAVYGSDAVAGVVNFILKQDFEGVEFDVSKRWTDAGGAGNTAMSLTLGGNFDGGRGNAVLAMSYNDREDLFQGDRAFSEDTLIDNGSGTFGTTGSINVPGTLFFAPNFSGFDPSVAPNYASEINNRCSNLGGSGADACWGFGLLTDGGGGAIPFRTAGPNNDRYNYAPTNYLQLPQERYNLASFLTYEINDHAEAYGRAFYTNAIVDSQLAPTPGGTQFDFTIDANNPFLTGELRDLFEANSAINVGDIDGDGVDEFQFTTGRRYEEIGTRNSLRDTHTFQLGGGLRGAINDNWNYDVYGHFARSRADQIQTGNVSISAVQAIVEEGRWNIFGGPGSLTPDLAEEISRTGAIFETNEQIQVLATVDGIVEGVRAPAAETPLGVAFGVEYRDEFVRRQPDSVLGPDVMGFNQSTFIEGSFDVSEVFAEANLPLIEGARFADYAGLNAGFRVSDYSSVGTTESFFFGGEWTPIETLRLRAQFQRAVRAPSVADLFQTDTNGFPGVQDPCAAGNGAFNLLSPEQQSTVIANCENLEGVPAGGVPVPQINSQVESIFTGAQNLEAEEADTITIGAQWSPSFAPGLSLTVDYYDIEIANALGGPTAQQVVNDCVLNGNPAACAITNRQGNGALDVFGDRLGTDPNGDGIRQSLGTENQVGLFVEGIDYGATYDFNPDWNFGSFRLGVAGTYTISNSFQPTQTLGDIECAGFYGADCGEPTPETKLLGNVTWMFGPLDATLRWSHIGEVTDVQTQFYGAYAEGLDVTDIDSFDYFDLSANYQVSDSIRVYGGVRNVFNEKPPILGDGPQSEQANTWPATYDPLGRQFFVGLTTSF